ncbi:MAG: ketol-acid reductoisomerase [Candidatus Eisenbacteria bacterium]|nr:ketol-acid reductoisomerase [Candidatus Eisenbacteria bacterium]
MSPVSSIYLGNDISLEPLRKRTVGIIGYGNQGRAQAQNLRDSGIAVVVGLRKGSASRRTAAEDGLEVKEIRYCLLESDIWMLLLPDEFHGQIFESEIAPVLKPGKALGFAHGMSVTSKDVVPPDGVDVFLVAPSAPGTILRENFVHGKGVPALFAVHRNATGGAKELALAYGKGIGCGRACLLETTFEEETTIDLFGEQAVVCGGVSALITTAFETLVESGYSPEAAYIECLHQLKLTVDLIHREGIAGMRNKTSNVALYGDLTRGPRLIDGSVKKTMRKMLEEIESGSFVKEWKEENMKGGVNLKTLKRNADGHDIERVGAHLRSILFGQCEGAKKSVRES